jgi:hypothetical protein
MGSDSPARARKHRDNAHPQKNSGVTTAERKKTLHEEGKHLSHAGLKTQPCNMIIFAQCVWRSRRAFRAEMRSVSAAPAWGREAVADISTDAPTRRGMSGRALPTLMVQHCPFRAVSPSTVPNDGMAIQGEGDERRRQHQAIPLRSEISGELIGAWGVDRLAGRKIFDRASFSRTRSQTDSQQCRQSEQGRRMHGHAFLQRCGVQRSLPWPPRLPVCLRGAPARRYACRPRDLSDRLYPVYPAGGQKVLRGPNLLCLGPGSRTRGESWTTITRAAGLLRYHFSTADGSGAWRCAGGSRVYNWQMRVGCGKAMN